jgi:hypothetical protein
MKRISIPAGRTFGVGVNIAEHSRGQLTGSSSRAPKNEPQDHGSAHDQQPGGRLALADLLFDDGARRLDAREDRVEDSRPTATHDAAS